MKQARNYFPIGVLLLCVAAVLVWFVTRPGDKPDEMVAADTALPSTPTETGKATDGKGRSEEGRKVAALKQIESAFNAPIAFYGRVVDQHGDPVAGALVGFAPVDGFLESKSYYESSSGEQGYFFVKGLKGAGMLVGVSKSGYYGIDGKSNMSFGYGMPPDSVRKLPPTKDNPAIFVLHKAGEAEPLVFLSSRQVPVPLTGKPTRLDLATGKTSKGMLQITSGLGEGTRYRYDWWFEFKIDGGGLLEREGEFDFIAPDEGYVTTMRIEMFADDENWQSRVNKDYFLKFSNGTYARIKMRIYPNKRRNMMVIESHHNPSGSRNLEYDASKTVPNP